MNNIFDKTLKSNRLILRRLKSSDVQDMFEFTSSPEVTKYLEWEPQISVSQSEKFISNALQNYSTNNASYIWGIELITNKKLVGVVRLYDYKQNYRSAEISYILNPNYQGKGLMFEALKTVLDFCFDELYFNRIQGKCSVQNIGSAKLMQKLGLKIEGVLRQFFIINGIFHDAIILSIIDKDRIKVF